MSPYTWIAAVIVCAMCSCTNDNQGVENGIQNNGTAPPSELALLMRGMAAEAERLREDAIAGRPMRPSRYFDELHSATPTEPGMIGANFPSLATDWLLALRQLEQAGDDHVFRYNRMVQACMSCHAEHCPGPRKRIAKLFVE